MNAVVQIRNLRKSYPIYGLWGKFLPPRGWQKALADVSLDLERSETYGLVGESGCGKSTLARSILGLVKPDGGEVLYEGRELTRLSDRQFRPLRRDLQMVFQDTLSSLNPRKRVGELLEEPLLAQRMGNRSQRCEKIVAAMRGVGLSEEYYFRWPHELSGGQLQRLGIARALIVEPRVVVCDEPVSALDVSIQAQVLNTLLELQRRMKLTMLFISHDIGVVRVMSHRIGVMYVGTLVEEAATDELFARPLHPYTRALFDSVPDYKGTGRSRPALRGEPPLHDDAFRGCVFHTRCPLAQKRCFAETPPLRRLESGRRVACHLAE
ncbi:oligopeptide ABC transporter ATP-binding protein OppF [Pyramidobacter sp. C12-8]|nr:oligopeptide ABC transporter ATP-binding protein OppF [Pyramidobacter sp. C12-8]